MLCNETVNVYDWADDADAFERSVSLGRESLLAKARREILDISRGHPRRSDLVSRYREMSQRSRSYDWIGAPDGGIRVEKDDDAIILEWTHGGAVLGFTFAPDARDTGYYFAVEGEDGALPHSGSGTAAELTPPRLLGIIRTLTK